MSSSSQTPDLIATLGAAQGELNAPLERFRHELDFCRQMLEAHPEQTAEWGGLLAEAVTLVTGGLRAGRTDAGALVAEAEQLLAPLAAAAQAYTLFCVGHAHIDMNWMWTWPETVSVCYDTFTTMDQLLEEFPEFHFSQSQVSVYKAMQEYAPEVFARIQQRVAEGRWEVTASHWVEGDKNLASGEILCRHLLYSKRWLRENLGLPLDAVKIDWPCDTFGHAWTNPSLLRRGGVTRYYHHRTSGPRRRAILAGETARLFWWEGPDGSRVLAFDDCPQRSGYNGIIEPQMVDLLMQWERTTGLQAMMYVYGVGDHGGGPTRNYLRAALEMQKWPLWPTLKLTTSEDFFSTVEGQLTEGQIPVLREELNFVIEGCYSSESRIKFANRQGENALVQTEAIALYGSRLGGVEYPRAALAAAWERAMFLQFHDILPGSGVRETREYALGQFQETLATTGSLQARSLRALARRVDTSALATPVCGDGMSLGAGVGHGAYWTGISNTGAGEACGDPFLLFNPAPFERDELIRVKVWNRDVPPPEPEYRGVATPEFRVRDSAGQLLRGQTVDTGNYWGHNYHEVAFPVRGLPGLGYRAVTLELAPAPDPASAAYLHETGRPVYPLPYMAEQVANPVVLGNEFLELVVDAQAGGIISLVDKQTGGEMVGEGGALGSLERQLEGPHPNSAWLLAEILDTAEPLAGSRMVLKHRGPNLVAVQLVGKFGECDYTLTISLAAGSRRIDFEVDVNWLERGTPETGVPTLRVIFPLAIEAGRAHCEIPCGVMERAADGEEVPALNWVDLTGSALWLEGQSLGATLLNDCKYGHRLSEDTLQLTLLRSSYEPDPLPEYGRHQIRFALLPHIGDFDADAAVRAGYAFNHPCLPVSATVHAGDLPPEAEGVALLSPGVMLSGLKQAEDSEAVIMRLYEIAGQDMEAQVRLAAWLAAPNAPVVETDTLEQPLAGSTARLEAGVLKVNIPAHGIVTVRVG